MRKSTMEQYLKNIYHLEKESGIARTKLLAERMGVTPPSVSEFCRKLMSQGYIAWEPYRGAKLTARGLKIVSIVEQRYETLVEFLQMLGLDQSDAVIEACRMEHEISDESVDRLRHLMGKID